jgi:DNA-binding MarR family transcriptional regulator
MAEGAVIDAETKAMERPRDHKSEVRLWLRLLTCTNLIETEIRRRLREQFDVTLPRFDLMAQLHKAERDVSLGELSRRMMVTNGNVTSLVEVLVDQGMVDRRASPLDKRAVLVRLTEAGIAEFEKMAEAHEGWIAELMGDLEQEDREQLMTQLGRLKRSVRSGTRRDPT